MSTIIETDRIILRRFVLEDAEDVFAYGSNSKVNRYIGNPDLESIDEAQKIITHINFPDYDKHGYGRYAVYHKADKKVIGFAGLKFLPQYNMSDIGYRFLPEYWGKGIATEVCIPLMKYGFETLNLETIIGIAMKENIASCRVLEKIGLKFWKTEQYDGDGGDHCWYKLDRKDYL
jgi:[ribosomal protein S5]-alanine N-acetyltransferase